MSVSYTEQISIKGKRMRVEAFSIGDKEIVVTGKIIKMARIKGELDQDVEDPNTLVEGLKGGGVKADIFTFCQRLPEVRPKFDCYHLVWDNVAALPVTSFQHWWKEQIGFRVRNKVRKAEKLGVTFQVVKFDDNLIRGIMEIYNESPIRQGKPFWHYGKDFETVKRDNGTFLDRSDFIGAYHSGELIGFIKLVNYGRFADLMQIVSKLSHRDKAPTNGLIAKAVEVCAEKGVPYLTYAKFVYGKKGSDTLTDFKSSNGFQKIDLPRYYIPLTAKGAIALRLNLHQGSVNFLPEKLVVGLIGVRNRWYKRKYKHATEFQKDT